MRDDPEKPFIVGVVSAGPTAALDPGEPLSKLLPPMDRVDLGPASALPDRGLFHFAVLMAAARSKMGGRRPLALTVRGAAETRARVLTGFGQLLTAAADLILFWTFSPLMLPGEPAGDTAFDSVMAEAAARGTPVIFPAATGFGARCPGMIGCGAAVSTAPYLDAVAVPEGWPDPAPDITAWADWPSFRAAWLGAGLVDWMPVQMPFPAHLCLPVWTASAILMLLGCGQETKMSPADAASILSTMAVPVSIRPQRLTPRLGFLDPRLMDAVSMAGNAALRAAHA